MSETPEGFPKSKEPKPDEKLTPSQRGKRNRVSGKRYQREARKTVEKLTGTQAARFVGQLGNEEAWHGLPWRIEVKSGKQTNPAVTAYFKAKDQSDRSRAHADVRPFVNIVVTQRRPAIAQIALTDLPEVLRCLLANFEDADD